MSTAHTGPAVGAATVDAAAELARAALELLIAPEAPPALTDRERVEASRILRAAAHLLDPPPPRPPAATRPRWVHVDDVAAIATIQRAPTAAPPPPAAAREPTPVPAAAVPGPPADVAPPLRAVAPSHPTPAVLAARRPR